MSSTHTLEKALFKLIGSDWSVVNNQERFDSVVKGLFDKRQVKEGIRDYLSSHASAPNIMSLLLYSQRGIEFLVDLIENRGIPNSRVYDPLMFDGSFMCPITSRFPLREKIAEGGAQWHFDAHEWFDKMERLTAFPGFIEAMVHRYRLLGRMDQVIRHMKLRTLTDLLEHEPQIFAVEVGGVSKEMMSLVNEENRYRDIAVCLVRTHLDREEAIGKILGSRPNIVP